MIKATKLYELCKEIPEEYLKRNKYCYLAVKYGLPYALIDNSVVIHNKLHMEMLPRHIVQFINEMGDTLFLYNGMGGIFRGIKEKKFYTFGSNVFYGIFDLDPDFKYGDPIVLVEGAVDRDVCSKFYHRNTLGVLSSGLSRRQTEVIKALTNRVILAYDFDEAGRKGVKDDTYKLRKLGIDVKELPSFGLKDFGDVIELEMRGREWDFTQADLMIKNNLRSLI